ncbi:MAG: RNA pseudouridine synthase [Candidatus Magasanikbacteria bacterium]
MLEVLYEDNHLIAVNKPAGVLVQGDITGDKCIADDIKEYLKKKYQKPGNVFLGTVHRLDRPVSGVVLFAKTSKGAARLSEQVREHKLQKIYHALVVGIPKKSKTTLINWLSKDEKKNFVTVYDKETSGAQYAELDYEVEKSNGKNSLLKIILKTGRSHQIRSQLTHIGCPIAGDTKYGASVALPDNSIALCATSLTFQTATTGETKTVAIVPPFSL